MNARYLFAIAASLTTAAAAQDSSTALTIYSSAQPGAIPVEMYRPLPQGSYGYNRYANQQIPGYAVVKHERPVTLAAGRTDIRFTNVAAFIEPTTVTFESLTDPNNTKVIEQNYQFDLVNQAKLIERFIDQQIIVEQAHGDTVEQIRGKLLSATGGLILQEADGRIRTINGYTNILFPELPGGLLTRPTLLWDIYSAKGGDHSTRVTYQTSNITWWADYNIVFKEGANANKGKLDVGAWVSILNKSGATYPEAKLKLIAGDVNRAQQPGVAMDSMRMERTMGAAAPKGFEEKAFFEYHLYTLGRPTTIPENSTKQLELFETARDVPADKVLVYYGMPQGYYGGVRTDRNFGSQSNKKVDVYLRFKNEKRVGLGIPMPSGRIRVSQLDTDDGTLEFIGEDVIDHTPKNEEILIKLGSAFDVVGERKQMDFKIDTSRKWMEETVEIKLRNHKDDPVEVIVKENLYRAATWTIKNTDHPYEKYDARTIHFTVQLPPDSEKTIVYTARYTW